MEAKLDADATLRASLVEQYLKRLNALRRRKDTVKDSFTRKLAGEAGAAGNARGSGLEA